MQLKWNLRWLRITVSVILRKVVIVVVYFRNVCRNIAITNSKRPILWYCGFARKTISTLLAARGLEEFPWETAHSTSRRVSLLISRSARDDLLSGNQTRCTLLERVGNRVQVVHHGIRRGASLHSGSHRRNTLGRVVDEHPRQARAQTPDHKPKKQTTHGKTNFKRSSENYRRRYPWA